MAANPVIRDSVSVADPNSPSNCIAPNADGSINVKFTGSSGTEDVNLKQVAGVATPVGNGVTGTGSQRVTIASDNTPFAIKLDQTTPGTTNAFSLAQVGTTTVVTGGVNGSQGVGGLAASGAALAGNPNLIGGSDGTNVVNLRTISGGISTTGVGVLSTGLVGLANGTTLTTVSSGQYGPVQTGTNGAIWMSIIAPGATTIAGNSAGVGTAAENVGTQSSLNVTSQGKILGASNWFFPRDINGALGSSTTGNGTTAIEHAGVLFNQITTATTTLVKSGASILHKVSINTPVASATVKIYNATTATGTPITITIPSTVTGESPFQMEYDIYMSTGITVVTSGATDVTVTYR